MVGKGIFLQSRFIAGKAGEYILTSSQYFLLLEKITQSLAGRVALLQLLPFSLAELQNAGLPPASPEAFILTGGYPRIYDKHIDPADFYPSYARTYVERDVRQIVNVTDLRLFRQFLTACAGRAGQIINFLELGNVLGIDSKTVKSWVGMLEASFIVFLLPPYYRLATATLTSASSNRPNSISTTQDWLAPC